MRAPCLAVGLLAGFLVPVAARGAGLAVVDVQREGTAGVYGIAGAARTGVSPDGLDVYVTGNGDDALAVFRRDPATGRLVFVEAERDGLAGITGLTKASPLAVSPDGAYVYASGYEANAMAVFQRNAATGSLALAQMLRQGVDGADGLSFTQNLTVSPDGRHVYVVSYELAVFPRDATTGQLTFVETVENGDGGVVGLDNPLGATVSPDGAHVYVCGLPRPRRRQRPGVRPGRHDGRADLHGGPARARRWRRRDQGGVGLLARSERSGRLALPEAERLLGVAPQEAGPSLEATPGHLILP